VTEEELDLLVSTWRLCAGATNVRLTGSPDLMFPRKLVKDALCWSCKPPTQVQHHVAPPIPVPVAKFLPLLSAHPFHAPNHFRQPVGVKRNASSLACIRSQGPRLLAG